ncbi:hypothetical protein BDZ91DRAFT_790576 [Kalaharituber pfeilii]|nr:hypothetical protein BDZ91DRAFT_790576 [Kalaharituber pfeilii]
MAQVTPARPPARTPAPAPATDAADVAAPSPNAYLTSLLLHTLRVTTTDGRMFVGEFKCTDRDRNLILACTNEFRWVGHDAAKTLTTTSTTTVTTITTTTTSATSVGDETSRLLPTDTATEVETGMVTIIEANPNMGATEPQLQRRYLGLVVVPGEVIVKIELEEKKGGGGRR